MIDYKKGILDVTFVALVFCGRHPHRHRQCRCHHRRLRHRLRGPDPLPPVILVAINITINSQPIIIIINAITVQHPSAIKILLVLATPASSQSTTYTTINTVFINNMTDANNHILINNNILNANVHNFIIDNDHVINAPR